MSCHELVDLITAYLEGTLPRPERAGLEAHLEQCSHCRTYLEQMRQTIATLGTLREQGSQPRPAPACSTRSAGGAEPRIAVGAETR